MMPVNKKFTDTQWEAWHAQASAAMAALIENYAPGADVKLRDDLYKAAMPFLLKLSRQKCAYCESIITATQPGDVEHYRPKGRIRDAQGRIVKTTRFAEGSDHPGYWWLAYCWENLLPSCIDCNRRRRHPEPADLAGKADYFEVSGVRAELPDDCLEDEKAMLLDPAEPGFDPDEHFEFHEDGTIKPTTERAKYTCKLLGLNLRESLVAERRQAYLSAQSVWLNYFQTAPAAVLVPELARKLLAEPLQRVNALWDGEGSYTAFTRKALLRCQEAGEKVGIKSKLPLEPLN